MDTRDRLNKVHDKVMDDLFKRKTENGSKQLMDGVAKADQKVRGAVGELFMALDALNDPAIAIDVLSDHAAILVEMINQFKMNK
jgi:hypothetical protein